MASPGLVKGAAALSIGATTGAAAYAVSEGDPEKLKAWLRTAQDSAGAALGRWQAIASQFLDDTRSTFASAAAPGASDAAEQASSETAAPDTVSQDAAAHGLLPRSAERQTGAYCHTCSGPRLWFFAEKLRIKRRFTPHPDPARE